MCGPGEGRALRRARSGRGSDVAAGVGDAGVFIDRSAGEGSAGDPITGRARLPHPDPLRVNKGELHTNLPALEPACPRRSHNGRGLVVAGVRGQLVRDARAHLRPQRNRKGSAQPIQEGRREDGHCHHYGHAKPMTPIYGIDLGTTFTKCALVRPEDGALRVFKLDADQKGSPVNTMELLRSAVSVTVLDEQRLAFVGAKAWSHFAEWDERDPPFRRFEESKLW